jgi:hypothetical protein
MIICKKPCTIYDVDVIGIALLVVIAIAAWFGVVVPATADATESRTLSARTAEAIKKTEGTDTRLGSVRAQIRSLQNGVDAQIRSAPHPGSLTTFLQRVASIAEECGIEIVRMLPRPTQRTDGHLVGELQLSGRGLSLNFVRLLDRMARELPYHSLQDFTIKQPTAATDPRCTLEWTLRLHMLDDGSHGSVGETE